MPATARLVTYCLRGCLGCTLGIRTQAVLRGRSAKPSLYSHKSLVRLVVNSSLIDDRLDLVDRSIEDKLALCYFDGVVRKGAGEFDPIGEVGHTWGDVVGVAIEDESTATAASMSAALTPSRACSGMPQAPLGEPVNEVYGASPSSYTLLEDRLGAARALHALAVSRCSLLWSACSAAGGSAAKWGCPRRDSSP